MVTVINNNNNNNNNSRKGETDTPTEDWHLS